MDADALADLFTTTSHGVLATLKRDGRPQLSNILFAWDAEKREAAISVTDNRAKTRNLRRDPRASLHVQSADGWSYAVAEGTAAMTEVAREPHDAAAEALVDLYRRMGAEHPDWAEYRQAMIDDERLVLTVRIERFYGMAH